MRAIPSLALAIVCASSTLVSSQTPSSGVRSPAMHAVSGELAGELDSRTAKVGDQIVVKVRSNARIEDDVEIPKGSRLIGHVTGVKAAGAGDANSQIALAFDRIELKNRESLSIRGELESLSIESSGNPDLVGAAPEGASGGRASGDMYGSTPSAVAPSQVANQAHSSDQGPVVGARPNAGSVVAHSGDLTIRTTGISGLLLANHDAPAQSSSILLGTRRDVRLEAGTRVVLDIVSAPTTAAPTASN